MSTDRAAGAGAAAGAWRGRIVGILAVCLVGLVLVVIVTMTRGFDWRRQVPVTQVTLSGQDRLTLAVNTCGGEPELDLLNEQAGVIEVAVVSTRRIGGPGGQDCLDVLEVRLKEPLGDRRVIDGTTGRDLAVNAG